MRGTKSKPGVGLKRFPRGTTRSFGSGTGTVTAPSASAIWFSSPKKRSHVSCCAIFTSRHQFLAAPRKSDRPNSGPKRLELCLRTKARSLPPGPVTYGAKFLASADATHSLLKPTVHEVLATSPEAISIHHPPDSKIRAATSSGAPTNVA